MLDTGKGATSIFRKVEKIQIMDMQHQAHGYFGLPGIRNVGNQVFPKTLVVRALQNLGKNAQELQNLYNRVRPDMIAKAIEGSITKTFLKKLRLKRGEY